MASSSGLPWYTNDPDQPVRAVDLEVGAAEGELLAVGRMMDEAVAPAGPEIELVDHSSRWRGPASGHTYTGLGVEPEDQLWRRLHDLPKRNHLLIGRCWGQPVDRRVGAACEAVHRDRRQQDQPAASHDATR
jgi:hypothetical protein